MELLTPTNDSPTNIWAITRSNGQAYAYLRSANWIGAQKAAEESPEITRQAIKDGGYAMHRMRKGEVIEMLKERVSIPDLPANFCSQGLFAYLNNYDIDPSPEAAIAGLRQRGYLPAPYMRSPHLIYVCPRKDMPNVIDWAVNNMLNAYRQTETRVQDWKCRFFAKTELELIIEGTML